jgi:predicted regulator of amino acid metabolism with ACT domain
MDSIIRAFKGYPSQEKVVQEMLRSGVSVRNGIAYCNGIKLSDTAIGAACGVDHRVVRSTLDRINSDPKLNDIFSRMSCIALYADIAQDIGCTAIDIEPDNSRAPGILSEVAKVISDRGLSVRQAVVANRSGDDQHLLIVIEGFVPPELIYMIRNCRGVKTVALL